MKVRQKNRDGFLCSSTRTNERMKHILMLKCCFHYHNNWKAEWVCGASIWLHLTRVVKLCVFTPPPHTHLIHSMKHFRHVWKSQLKSLCWRCFLKRLVIKVKKTNGLVCGIFHQSDLFHSQMLFFFLEIITGNSSCFQGFHIPGRNIWIWFAYL